MCLIPYNINFNEALSRQICLFVCLFRTLAPNFGEANLDKSRRKKTEYTLAAALHTHVLYTLVRPSTQRAAAIRLQKVLFV